jgi:hypothetical protein
VRDRSVGLVDATSQNSADVSPLIISVARLTVTVLVPASARHRILFRPYWVRSLTDI